MNIAIVSPIMVPVPPFKYGGVEQVIAELAHGLAQRGHVITVFCSGESTIEGKGIRRVETSPHPTQNRLDKNRLRETEQLLAVLGRQREFDVIHFNYEPLILRLNIDGTQINLLDFFETPVACTFHNTTDIPENMQYYRASPSLHRHAMVFISENQRSRASFFPNSKVIYNGLPLEKFPVEEQKENYLLFLGRITPVKGILEAIAVAEKTQIPLVIAAKVDPVDRVFYENEVKQKIDGKLVRYVGEVDFGEKIEYLAKARALLFPILWEEPFGLVVIEALACGTPVIAFRRGSVPEIIQDGINGCIVDTVDEMVRAVNKITSISPLRCRKSVEEKFSAGRMISEYEELFQKIAARRQ